MTERRRLGTAEVLTFVAAVLAVTVVTAGGPDAAQRESSAAASGTTASGAASAVPLAAMPTSDTRRVVLGVSGMYCTSCERTVTALLTRSAGVVRAEVSVDRGEAVVLYDPARTTPAALVGTVERLGYRATVKPTSPT